MWTQTKFAQYFKGQVLLKINLICLLPAWHYSPWRPPLEFPYLFEFSQTFSTRVRRCGAKTESLPFKQWSFVRCLAGSIFLISSWNWNLEEWCIGNSIAGFCSQIYPLCICHECISTFVEFLLLDGEHHLKMHLSHPCSCEQIENGSYSHLKIQ